MNTEKVLTKMMSLSYSVIVELIRYAVRHRRDSFLPVVGVAFKCVARAQYSSIHDESPHNEQNGACSLSSINSQCDYVIACISNQKRSKTAKKRKCQFVKMETRKGTEQYRSCEYWFAKTSTC